jgi:hypothetical protein
MLGALNSLTAPGDVIPLSVNAESRQALGACRRADMVSLASQHGLFYWHPGSNLSAPPCQPPAAESNSRSLLGNLLAGQRCELEPSRPAELQPFDSELDDTQRNAVAAALSAPDFFLIHGGPGTGKSRVVAEIVTQAVKRGDRVLLLSAHASGLDHILEQVGQRDEVCPIRCLAPEERLTELPPTIRALTLQERASVIRENTLRTANQARAAAELQCARRRHEASLWPRLEELARTMASESEAQIQAEAKMAAVEFEVAKDAEASGGRLVDNLRTLKRAGQESQAKLSSEVGSVERQREEYASKLADLAKQVELLEPLATAKQRGRWWSSNWWKAIVKGNVVGKLRDLQAQHAQLASSFNTASQRLQELAELSRQVTMKQSADIDGCVKSEIAIRQKKISVVVVQHREVVRRSELLWTELCSQIQEQALRPTSSSIQAVAVAKRLWQQHRNEDDARCTFSREWAEFLESSSGALADKLPGIANLVAATPAALAADPHFSNPSSRVGQFDLVVVEEAHEIAESRFLEATHRAGRWVLVGCPSLLPQESKRGRHISQSARAELFTAKGEGTQWFGRLWNHLQSDSYLRPQAWFRENYRLGYCFRSVAREERKWLQNEPVADAPDVELRILSLPRARPELAEIIFPIAMTMGSAKDFLDGELGMRDLGRTAWLGTQYRMTSGLADIVYDWLGRDSENRDLASPTESEPPVEFISVLGGAKIKGPERNGERGPRVAEPTASRQFPACGAGLETELARLRPGDRFSNEIRGLVTGRGFVNLPEARAVVHKLEDLFRRGSVTRKSSNRHAVPVAVIALFPAQAELIGRLVQQSACLAAHASSIAIGPPDAFRQREADIALISLTRSHSHRAVAYGERPATLELALTRARRRLVLIGDPGNLSRRAQWRGAVDHLDEVSSNREAYIIGRIMRYISGRE